MKPVGTQLEPARSVNPATAVVSSEAPAVIPARSRVPGHMPLPPSNRVGFARTASVVNIRVADKAERHTLSLQKQLALQRNELNRLTGPRGGVRAFDLNQLAREALVIVVDPRAEGGVSSPAEVAATLIVDIATHAAELENNVSRNGWALVRGNTGSDVDSVARALQTVLGKRLSASSSARKLVKAMAHRAAERDERTSEDAKTVRSSLSFAERVQLTSIEPLRVDKEIARELLTTADQAINEGDGRFGRAVLDCATAGITSTGKNFGERAQALFLDEVKALSAKAEELMRTQAIAG